MLSARRGDLASVEYYLSGKDLNIDIKDKNGAQALSYAVFMRFENINVVKAHLAKPETEVNTEVTYHVEDNNQINLGKKCGYSCYGTTRSALQFAAVEGHKQIVQELLKNKNIDLNTFGPLALADAASSTATAHQAEIVKILLQTEKIDINAVGKSEKQNYYVPVLPYTVKFYGTIETVRELLRHPDLDINAGAPLIVVLENLLDAVESTDKEWSAEKKKEAFEKYTAIALLLIEYKSKTGQSIDVNVAGGKFFRSTDDYTALHLAAQAGATQIVRRLLKFKELDANARTSDDRNALALAAWRGHLDLVTILIEDTSVDLGENKFGISALAMAAFAGRTAVVEYLINHPRVRSHLPELWPNAVWQVGGHHNTTTANVFLNCRFLDKQDVASALFSVYVNFARANLAMEIYENHKVDLNYKYQGGSSIFHAIIAPTQVAEDKKWDADLLSLDFFIEKSEVNLNLTSDDGQTPLVFAIIQNRTKVRLRSSGQESE